MSEIKTDATNLIPISWEIFDQNLGQFLTILPGLGDEGPTTDIEGIPIFIQPVNNDNLYEDQLAVLQSNFEYTLLDSYPSTWQDTLIYRFRGIDGNGQYIHISKEDIVNGDVLLQIADNDYQDLYIQNSKAQEKEEERKEGGREEGREENARRKLKGGKKKRRRKTKKKKRKRRKRNTIKKIRLNIQKCKKCSKCYDNVVLHYKKCVKKCEKKRTRRRRRRKH
tara:strand:+ start:489 stop:1157 length:669 start_codon:yes stop_codon:yes gene_type:complete